MTAAVDAEGAARRAEWRRHWGLVAACAFGMAFYSLFSSTVGVFLEPISSDLGWNRTTVMYGMSFGAIAGILLSPVVGLLVDRYGARRIALPGTLLATGCLASFSLATGSLLQWTLLWLGYAVVLVLIKATVWSTAIASTFTAARSMAMAFAIGGSALSQAAGPPLAQALIEAFGWRGAMVAQSVGWGGLALLLAWFFLYDARDARRLAGQSASRSGQPGRAAEAVPLPGISLREALRNRSIIYIGLATLLTMTVGVGISVHQVPILVQSGVPRETAALLASLFGIAGLTGKLATGWLMDRFEPGRVGAVTMAAAALAFLLLLERVDSMPLIVAGLIVIGYGSGTKLQICAYLTSCYAGVRHYGKIFGVMSSLIALSGGTGPLLASAVFDLTASYDLFIGLATIFTLASSVLLLGLGPVPLRAVKEASEPGAAPLPHGAGKFN